MGRYKESRGDLIYTYTAPNHIAIKNANTDHVLITKCDLSILEAEFMRVVVAHCIPLNSIVRCGKYV